MRRHAKASSAGSNQGQLGGRARIAGLSNGFELRRVPLALCLATAFVFLVAAVPAVASAAEYVLGTPASFCSKGNAANQCETGVKGVAVDQSNGNVYLSDANNARLSAFDSSGNFLWATGWSIRADIPSEESQVCTTATGCKKGIPGAGAGGLGQVAAGARGVAVDSSTHIVYVAVNTNKVKFFDGSNGAFLGEFDGINGFDATNASMPPTPAAPAAFTNMFGIAVDTSGAQHYLYFAASTEVIDKFKVPVVTGGVLTTQASYVCQITGKETASATECAGGASKDGAFNGLLFTSGSPTRKSANIAVDSSGNVIIAEAESRGVVSVFSSSGAFSKQCTIAKSEAVAAGAAGHIYVAVGNKATYEGGTHVEEYLTSSCASVADFGAGTIGAAVGNGGSLGLAVDFGPDESIEHVYASDSSSNAKIWNFVPLKLRVTKAGTGTGTVTSAPAGINCGTECEGDFTAGAEVTLTASSGANSQTVVWAGCDSQPSATECKVTMSASKNVTATFNLEQHQLTVNKNGTGGGTVTSSPAGISCDPTCAANFDHGTPVTLTAASNPGSQTVVWSGCDSQPSATECKVTMSAAKNVTATFDLIPGKLLTVSKAGSGAGTVTSSPAGINCGSDCDEVFTTGAEVTLTASSGANSQTVVWSGCDSQPSATECKVTMTAAKIVTATFNLEQRGLTVSKAGSGTGTVTSSPAGISCDPTCAANFDHGTSVTLSGAAGANTKAVVWSGCDSVNGSNQCVVAMTAAKTVTATFNLEQRGLTVSKAGSGTGTVTSSPAGISCGSTCSANFDHGTSVTLSGAAGANTKAVVWSGCDSVNGSNQCVVAMTAAKTVTATFGLVTHSLTVAAAGSGSGAVTCNGGACAPSYEAGTTVTLAATPTSDSEFKGWSGACTGSGACVVTINANTAVTATFDKKPSSPPPTVSCVVPKLAGKKLGEAKSALTAAHCTLGKVTKPKAKKGKKLGPLVVKSSKPAAGETQPEGSKVDLKLGPKPKPKKKAHK